MGEKLGVSFFNRGAKEVAQELLGQILVHRISSKEILRARITETEAYIGTHDKACHAHKGRTERTEPLFGPPGFAYVYLCYGMYDLFNVVCSYEGDAQAVLIRGGIPLHFKANLSGPGRFARGMKISRKLNRISVLDSKLFFERGEKPSKIFKSPRIGVDYAGGWARRHLRYFTKENPHLTKQTKAFKYSVSGQAAKIG